eukprot:gnl/Hemi2/1551_TR555_c0_g1_i1.p2 gnl/Hemi2/1551_TR555_c0_g1~~gnl/Hemi2/1551_TR555_c0_g1_i1.p2  ORF type:complete len:382 (-),score=99.73 gnl/Hemi2/1551_TR555_c0_g1_i1:77-1141(-)
MRLLLLLLLSLVLLAAVAGSGGRHHHHHDHHNNHRRTTPVCCSCVGKNWFHAQRAQPALWRCLRADGESDVEVDADAEADTVLDENGKCQNQRDCEEQCAMVQDDPVCELLPPPRCSPPLSFVDSADPTTAQGDCEAYFAGACPRSFLGHNANAQNTFIGIIKMDQAISCPAGPLGAYTQVEIRNFDPLSSCSVIAFLNAATGAGGLYHYPGGGLTLDGADAIRTTIAQIIEHVRPQNSPAEHVLTVRIIQPPIADRPETDASQLRAAITNPEVTHWRETDEYFDERQDQSLYLGAVVLSRPALVQPVNTVDFVHCSGSRPGTGSANVHDFQVGLADLSPNIPALPANCVFYQL